MPSRRLTGESWGVETGGVHPTGLPEAPRARPALGAPPPAAASALGAHLHDADGGGVDGGGLREVVQVVDPHGQDLWGARGGVGG